MNKNSFESQHQSRRIIAAFACAVTAGSLLSTGALAQQWTLAPELRLGFEYDDNARLQTDPATIQEIDGFIAEGALGIGYATQRTTFEFTPRLRSRVYDEIPDVDSNDQFLNINFNHETLKSEFGIRATYARESVRTAERAEADLDEDEPDDIPTDETGIVLTDDTRERLSFSPRWSYRFTERAAMGVRFDILDVSYDDPLAGFLIDYTDRRFSVNLSREFTPRTRWYVEGTARNYENEFDVNDVDGIGASIGMLTEISETTRFQAKAGFEETEQTATGESESSFVGDLNLVRKLETVTFLAQYRRSISPGGNGRVSARDSFNVNLTKRFTERVSGGLGFRIFQREAIGSQTGTVEERDSMEFRAQLAVALSRAFSLEGRYRYDKLDRTGLEGTADANIFNLTLVYKPTPIVN
jgi:hypothetical protein